MEDFEPPSFSLGFDRLFEPSPTAAFSPLRVDPSNSDHPFPVPASDSDFETPLPCSRNTTALKRLRRRSSPFFPGAQCGTDVLHAAQDSAFKSSGKGAHEEKNSSLRSFSSKKSGISSANTLQRLWNGLNAKVVACSDDSSKNAVDGFACEGKPSSVQKDTTTHESGRRQEDGTASFQNTVYAGFADNKNNDCKRNSFDEDITIDVDQDFINPQNSGGIRKGLCSLHDNEIPVSKFCTNVEASPAPGKNLENIATEFTNGNNALRKSNVLQSFWKSLNTGKLRSGESNTDDENEDIEDCSTDDDYDVSRRLSWNKLSSPDYQMQYSASPLSPGVSLLSPRKFSLAGNVAKRKSSVPSASLHVSEYEQLGNVSGQSIARCRASSSNSSKKNPTSKPRSTENTNSSQHMTWQNSRADDFVVASHNVNTHTESNVSRGGSGVISDDHLNHRLDYTGLSTLGGLNFASNGKAISSFQSRPDTCVPTYMTQDPRIIDLLRNRFPHFITVSELRQGTWLGPEQTYIDYENQFSGSRNASRTISNHFISSTSKYQNRIGKKPNSRKMCGSAMADNDGWIQTSNRDLVGSKGSSCGKQSRGSATINEESVAGHWVTEKTGKRIYITKDGRKLSGPSAYKQHIKDSGKRFKKTKRQRPCRRK